MESVFVQFLIENYNRKKPLTIENFMIDSMVEFNKILSTIKYNFYTKLGTYEVFSETVNSATCEKLRNEPQLAKTVQKKQKDIQILCEVEAYQQNSGKV